MIDATCTRRRLFQRAIWGALGALALPDMQRLAAGREHAPQGHRALPSSASILAEHGAPPTLALSLTALQAEASQLQRARQPLPDTLAHLGGMNRIQGFMAETAGELILLGAHDSSLAPLHLDDLAVSLRNAHQVSPAYRGVPGCTIDPWPGAKDPWRIQVVKVFGMPACSMAQRHVAIDADLKRVSAGIVSLGDGVTSLYELNRLGASLCTGPMDRERTTEVTHRFWFYPRYPPSPRFLADAGSVLVLRPVGVQLLTEQQFLDRTGQRAGAAPATPQAEQFVRMITQLMATNPPRDYAHLCSDFRVIELGKLIHYQQVPAANLRYLLQEHVLTEVAVPAFVGGVRREERDEVVCASQIIERLGPKGKVIETHERVQRHHRRYRGGVEALVSLAADQFGEDRGGVLTNLRRQVRASRPSPRTLLWPIAT